MEATDDRYPTRYVGGQRAAVRRYCWDQPLADYLDRGFTFLVLAVYADQPDRVLVYHYITHRYMLDYRAGKVWLVDPEAVALFFGGASPKVFADWVDDYPEAVVVDGGDDNGRTVLASLRTAYVPGERW